MIICLNIDGTVAMKSKEVLGLFFSVLLIMLLAISVLPLKTSGQENPRVHNLRTGKSYEAIQEAIDESKSGDTLYVGIGTYRENVVVNKTISLVGENKSNTIIDGAGIGNVIYVTADNVEIRGFTIENSGSILIYGGVYADHSSGHKIIDNIIKDNEYGIYLSYSSENSVLNNTVLNNSYGFGSLYTTNNVFSKNNFLDNHQDGIKLYYSTNNVFSENNVSSHTRYGAYLLACTGNVFSNNRVVDNYHGFYVSASTSNKFFGNSVLNNSRGFSVGTSLDSTFSGNNISSNKDYGVWLVTSRTNVFSNNYLVDNGISLRLATSDNNLIYHNNFINTITNTTQQPISIESQNSWNNGIEGNYWSSYNGSDKIENGIGDTAYIINENTNDSYPLMSIFMQFNLSVRNKAYTLNVVSNSTISSLRHLYHQANNTAKVSFQVNNSEGKGFCRICIPHDLVGPPYKVIANYNISLTASTVHRNKTHTWLYFTYDYSEHEPTTIILLSQEQPVWYQLWFWVTIFLAAVVTVLFLLVIRYHRMSIKQKKLIQVYEFELQMRAHKYLDTARAFFEADVKRRKAKIKKFEKKYKIKVRPRENFEDIVKLEFEKKEKERVTD